MENVLTRKNILISLFIMILIIFFVLQPKQNMEALFTGVTVWATNLLPALFPFLFFTKLLTSFGLVEKLSTFLAPITNKLYHTQGISAYVYLLSILSGYPVGAKICADLYENGQLSYGQACRTVTFTSTSGPLFIIGTVGIGLFQNSRLGLVVLCCHLISALINGLLWRNYAVKQENSSTMAIKPKPLKENLLEDAMLSSLKSVFIIGGYVALFFMIIVMLNNYNLLYPVDFVLSHLLGLFHLPVSLSGSIINGFIEITKGCFDLSTLPISFDLQAIVCTAIITFGGLSVHMQAFTFLKRFNIKFSFYFLQKITHTLVATVLCALFLLCC